MLTQGRGRWREAPASQFLHHGTTLISGQFSLARLPLAEATLTLWQFIGNDDALDGLYERHRGRTYERKITFPLMAQLVRDAANSSCPSPSNRTPTACVFDAK